MNTKPEIQQPLKKYCAYCEKEIHGREGKIYCDVDCKNNFNARIRAEKRAMENQLFPKVVTQMKKNHRILINYKLHELEADKTISVHSDELRKQGFDPRFCTGADYRQQKGLIKYCFDYAWIKQGNWFTLSYEPDLSKRW